MGRCGGGLGGVERAWRGLSRDRPRFIRKMASQLGPFGGRTFDSRLPACAWTINSITLPANLLRPTTPSPANVVYCSCAHCFPQRPHPHSHPQRFVAPPANPANRLRPRRASIDVGASNFLTRRAHPSPQPPSTLHAGSVSPTH
jgi:hypothetical protein